MDLHDLWQTHKRFLLGVAAGLLVFVILDSIIGALWDPEASAREVLSRASRLRRMEAPSSGQLARVRAERARLEERLETVLERLRWEEPERYRVPPEVNAPDLLYNEVRSRAREDLVQVAARHGIRVDESLGLPEFTPSGREAIQRFLRGLAVVEEIVGAGIVAGVAAIPELEIVEETSRRRSTGARFVEPLRVRFVVEGTTAAVAEVLHTLLRRESGAFVLDDARIETDEREGGVVTVARVTVAALDVRPDVRLTEAGERR